MMKSVCKINGTLVNDTYEYTYTCNGASDTYNPLKVLFKALTVMHNGDRFSDRVIDKVKAKLNFTERLFAKINVFEVTLNSANYNKVDITAVAEINTIIGKHTKVISIIEEIENIVEIPEGLSMIYDNVYKPYKKLNYRILKAENSFEMKVVDDRVGNELQGAERGFFIELVKARCLFHYSLKDIASPYDIIDNVEISLVRDDLLGYTVVEIKLLNGVSVRQTDYVYTKKYDALETFSSLTLA